MTAELQPSPLRISTMTVTGHLGAIPNLQNLFDNGAFIPYWWIGEGIIKLEFAGTRRGICMEDILHTTTKTKKHFYNQSSLVFRLQISPTQFKETNIKLFKNGGFQMTGVNSEAMARAALTRLIELNADPSRGIWPVDTKPYIQKFNTCMINSDYSISKAIRRDRLYRVLVEDYGLWSTYEPTIYQGVNTKFFWNKTQPADAPPGICVCPTPCEGDGDGYSVGSCKKITIAPFRTGKIIITGAKHMEQLEDAYKFMNSVFTTHADSVLRDPSPTDADAPVATPPVRKKTSVPLTTTEAILRHKMRASPRNIVRLAAIV
jgi:TATA-box binding protein (TBP) (component of TFIID and TFIIIB)